MSVQKCSFQLLWDQQRWQRFQICLTSGVDSVGMGIVSSAPPASLMWPTPWRLLICQPGLYWWQTWSEANHVSISAGISISSVATRAVHQIRSHNFSSEATISPSATVSEPKAVMSVPKPQFQLRRHNFSVIGDGNVSSKSYVVGIRVTCPCALA